MNNYILRRRGLGKISCALISQHSEVGIEVKRNDQRLPEASHIIRWGVISSARAEVQINTPAAIHKTANKLGFRKLLAEKDLCPKTWTEASQVLFPCIVRPEMHSRGQNLYVCRDQSDLSRAIRACGFGWYASEFIDKKSEFRIYAAQNRVVGVGEKHPATSDSVAWNMFMGGSCKNVRWTEWPSKIVKAGLEAHKLSGLDFGAIDVIVDRENRPYVLESNSAPTLANYRAQAFAKVFDYMVENGKIGLELSTRPGAYKKFIHPAICEEAWTE